MSWPERDALLDEAAAAEASAGQAPPEATDWPGLGTWSLARLVGHLVAAVTGHGLAPAHGSDLTSEPLVGAAPDAAGASAEIDRVGFYRRHMALVEAGEAHEPDDPDPGPPEQWPVALADARAQVASTLATADPAALVETRYGSMTVGEQVAVRALEVTVHHMDLRAALALGPEATPLAGRVAQDLLEQLLEGPRPRNLGRTRFVRAATGRVTFRDPRFPVLR